MTQHDDEEQGQVVAPPSVSRRGFLEWMIGSFAGLSALSVLVTILSYLKPHTQLQAESGPIEVAGKDDIPLGEGRIVHFKEKPAVLIRTEKGFVAFSAVCTHAGCVVQWQADKQRIFCPCHAAAFDINGNVISGPPPRPLDKYRVVERGTKILLAER